MSLSNTFTTIFDKAISNGNAHEYDNKWVVEEHGQSATMTHLEVTGSNPKNLPSAVTSNDPFGSDSRW